MFISRYTRGSIFIMLFFLGMHIAAVAQVRPTLVDGVIDLRGWTYPNGTALPLYGDWEYYPGTLIDPADFADPVANNLPAPDYGGWVTNFPLNDDGYPFGYGTFRAIFLVDPGRVYALEISNQDTAHRCYLDGALIASDGVVSTEASDGVPSRRTHYYFWTPSTDHFELVLHISNYHHYKGGLINKLYIGPAEMVNNRHDLTMVMTFGMLCLFLFMAFFFFASFIFLRGTSFNLWICLLCLTFGLRILCTGQAYISLLWPSVDWQTITRGGFLSEAMLLPLFVLYLRALFPAFLPRPVSLGCLIFAAVQISLVSGLVPQIFYAKFLHKPFVSAYFIGTILFALRLFYMGLRGKRSAYLYGLSLAILAAVILNKTLVFGPLQKMVTFDVSNLGFVFFLISQSLLLAYRNARAYRDRDQLATTLEKQVLERTAELYSANRKLRRHNAEREFFLMSLSHDIRTPITIILNYINQVSQRHPDDPDLPLVRSNLDKILHDMVNTFDLLRLRTDRHFIAGDSMIDVSAEFSALERFYRYSFDHAKLTLLIDCPSGLKVRGNPRAFNRMCANYLENALRYAEQGGTIYLVAGPTSNDSVIIRVENNGPLIDIDTPSRLFKPFFQLQSGKGGTGLGLTIVARLARISGGKAGYEHRVGRNSFFFVLPAAFDAAISTTTLIPESEVSETIEDSETDRLILVVEDSDEIRSMYIEMLHPRYLLRIATNGREALSLLEGGLRPDLILSDVMMDDVDGFTLLAELDRLYPACSAGAASGQPMPILFVTAMTSASEKIPVTLRPVRILVKPFTHSQLLRNISDLLGTGKKIGAHHDALEK